MRTIDRIVRFGFANYDIEAIHEYEDPCITIWRHTHRVPDKNRSRWPTELRNAETESWQFHTTGDSFKALVQ